MKSFLENFKELSVDELLSINGGYSSYSNNSGYYSFSYSSSSYGGGGRREESAYEGASGNVSYASLSGNVPYALLSSKEKQVIPKDEGLGDIPDVSDRIAQHGTNEGSGAYKNKNVGLGWTSSESTTYSSELEHEYGHDKFLNRVQSLATVSETTEESLATKEFVNSLEAHQYDKYQTIAEGNKSVYMCDDFVQEVLTDAGVDYNDYFAGSAATTNCDTHIKNMCEVEGSGYSKTVPTEKGVYVVLMNESRKNFRSHTAFYVVDDEGSYAIDNSSGNYSYMENGVRKCKGGVEETICDSSGLCCKFGYNSFYYKKLEF